MDFLKLKSNSDILKKIFTPRKRINSSLFYFALKTNEKPTQFKINIDTRCLVLSQYPGAETRGLGGLIAQYPKNFEVLSLTNGAIPEKNEAGHEKRQQFIEVMKQLRTKGFKVFNINTGTIKENFSTIKKIDISEVDFVFLPNLYDNNEDTFYLLKYFKELLKTKEHKPDLKIIMFESDYALAMPDCFADISNIIETKKKMLDIYYPEKDCGTFSYRAIAINSFRAVKGDCKYCEAFMTFTIEDFLKINLI